MENLAIFIMRFVHLRAAKHIVHALLILNCEMNSIRSIISRKIHKNRS